MQKPLDRLPPLDLLASFEAAARLLSFTRAGEERFITQSAMSRQIRALEEDLGVALFRRRHRALALTEEGLRLQAVCGQALAQIRGVVKEIRAPGRRELLSLTTTPGFASLWLIPRLPAFTKLHPGIDVRLDATFERRDLRRDGFDLAIRYGRIGSAASPGAPAERPGRSEGIALFGETMQPVCSPALLHAGQPPLRMPADLRRHTLLQMTAVEGGMPLEWDPWLQAVGLADLEPAARLHFSAYGEAVAAALAGQGVAIGRRPLVDGLLKSGQLLAPFADAAASQRAYFLVIEPSARVRPAVRALEAWLLAQAGA